MFFDRRYTMFGLNRKCSCYTIAIWIVLACTLVYATVEISTL